MNKTTGLFIAIGLAAMLVGCSKSVSLPIEPKAYHNELEKAPIWVLNPDNNTTSLSASGNAQITDLGIQFAIDEAENAARVSLARQIEVKVSAMNESFKQIIGKKKGIELDTVRSETSRTIAHQTLVGVRRSNIWISPAGEVWVRMQLTSKSLQELKDGLHETYGSVAAKYQKEQAKDSLKVMDEEIDKLNK